MRIYKTIRDNVNMKASPFIKWAGGKGKLLDKLIPMLPTRYNRYIEPFLGGGALFFAAPDRRPAILADANPDLITTYRMVKDEAVQLAQLLDQHRAKHSKEYYYQVRSQRPENDLETAARFIYLNKTCYNGLYRVNRRGQFNVPIGSYTNPKLYDPYNLAATSHELATARIYTADYMNTIDEAHADDFVYLDPPYLPTSATASFTSYTSTDFTEYDQYVLAAAYQELDRRGCYVMLSNSDTPLIRELYKRYHQTEVPATRAINSRGDRRGPVTELVITNYVTK